MNHLVEYEISTIAEILDRLLEIGIDVKIRLAISQRGVHWFQKVLSRIWTPKSTYASILESTDGDNVTHEAYDIIESIYIY